MSLDSTLGISKRLEALKEPSAWSSEPDCKFTLIDDFIIPLKM